MFKCVGWSHDNYDVSGSCGNAAAMHISVWNLQLARFWASGFFFSLRFYLLERVAQRGEIERSSMCCFTPQMVTRVRVMGNPKPAVPSVSPLRGRSPRTRTLCRSLRPSVGSNAGSGAAGPESAVCQTEVWPTRPHHCPRLYSFLFLKSGFTPCIPKDLVHVFWRRDALDTRVHEVAVSKSTTGDRGQNQRENSLTHLLL